MATIDLTLNGLKVPAIDGYTPPFGTKITRTESNKGGLSTLEVNNNVMLPFAMMRPKTVTEDSLTTNVEYDAKVVFSSSLQAATTLSIGNGTYEGCEVLVKNLSAYTCTVDHGAWSVDIPAGGYVKIEWNGSAWSADVSEAVHAAIENYVDTKNSYSTTETLTGGTWINGKPIYMKVCENISNGASIGIDNIDEVIILECMMKPNILTDPWTPLTYSYNGHEIALRMNLNTNTWLIQVRDYNLNNYSIFAIVYYTKTTDPTP